MSGVVLITGTSSGIGLHTAVRAASSGRTVVATMRDLDRSEALRKAAADAGVTVDIRRLDVTDVDSITDCVDGVIAAHGRLDAAVNNAGWAGSVPTIEMCDLDRYRTGFEVNFFGVVAVTKAVMPHLRATRGRLLTVGSTRGLIAQPFNEGYSAAKFAVEGFMESLSPTAAAMGVTVVMVEPGPVFGTSFAANAGTTPQRMLADAGPYADVLKSYLDWFANTEQPGAQTAAELAEIMVRTLDDPAPPFRVMASDWTREYAGIKFTEPEGERVRAMTASWLAGREGAG